MPFSQRQQISGIMSSVLRKVFKSWPLCLLSVECLSTSLSFLNINSSVPLSELRNRRESFINKLNNFTKQLADKSSFHVVIIPASEVQCMAYHVPYPFHQDSNFFYFTGLNEPNGVLLFCSNKTEGNNNQSDSSWSTHLFVETLNKHDEIWKGPSMTLSDASLITGVNDTHSLIDFNSFLHHQVSFTNSVCIWYSPLSSKHFVDRPINKFVLNKLLHLSDGMGSKSIRFENPDYVVDSIRLIKSTYEIRQIKTSVIAAIESLESAMQITKPGIAEATLQNHIEYQMRSRGCSVGYPPVVAGGNRTNIIHYMKNNMKIEGGELVLVDAGCRFNGYTSDITRTWPVDGKFSAPQRVVHEILLDVQRSCASLASPERSLQDLYHHMLSEIGRHLVNESIIPDQDTSHVAQKVCPHHVGHYLGLDIHDTPTVPNTKLFEAGIVFPLEPGIYFRDELAKLGVRKEFLGIGMRIEDDFVITKSGRAENLKYIGDVLPITT
ncbi:putative Xaa-Pro aminopeptidase 3 isoform 1 [Schistosoma japonicum]|nr:Xaa-Pro aminopeptidase 3 [Schistosoma japonicum]TNN16491.1 putative Xaa-Pro aminopeptidase 3 isoform 1 [Schistosoma japonicum]